MSGAAPAPARPQARATTAITARLAAPLVLVGEPATVVARVKPAAAGVTLVVQRLVDDTWTAVGDAVTDRAGQAELALDTSEAGAQSLRVVLPAARARAARTLSPAVRLTVTAGDACSPKIALVDKAATPAARCLAARLDRWKSSGLMGVGQQLNMSSDQYDAPLTALGDRRVSVVGFDLAELAETGTYEYPFLDRALASLIGWAQQGAVLSASWHVDNPHTGGRYDDRSWTALDALLDETSPDGQRFWADFDSKLALFAALQDAGVAVVFRPFHEANGGWFWWGHPKPATYRKLYRMLQRRAWAAGVHNIVWAYGFNAVTGSHVTDPVALLPAKVDLAGIDSYDPETGAPADKLPMTGYAEVAKMVKRMAITEAGPYDSTDGSWNPAVIGKAAKKQKRKPLWSMLWFDDSTGVKQLSTLNGGTAWLDSCPNAFCYLR